MNYKNHLFIPINEVLDDKTMMDLGKMWQKHHDRNMFSRFKSSAEKESKDALDKIKPLIVKSIRKKKQFETMSKNNPNIDYNKRISHLRNYTDKARTYEGKKRGWEEYPGIDLSTVSSYYPEHGIKHIWAKANDINSIVNTKHQRAGERSMAAIGRLTDYMNRNGINQENPTDQDKQNYQSWVHRTAGRFLKK